MKEAWVGKPAGILAISKLANADQRGRVWGGGNLLCRVNYKNLGVGAVGTLSRNRVHKCLEVITCS
jgi:hypothetical protein